MVIIIEQSQLGVCIKYNLLLKNRSTAGYFFSSQPVHKLQSVNWTETAAPSGVQFEGLLCRHSKIVQNKEQILNCNNKDHIQKMGFINRFKVMVKEKCFEIFLSKYTCCVQLLQVHYYTIKSSNRYILSKALVTCMFVCM